MSLFSNVSQVMSGVACSEQFKKIKSVATGWGGVALSDILSKAIGFFLLPIYAKKMPPGDYGVFNYSSMIVGVIALVFGLGQYAIYTRAESEMNEDAANLMRGSVIRNLIIGQLLWIVSFVIIFLFFKGVIFSSPQSCVVWAYVAVQPIVSIYAQIMMIDLFLVKKYKTAAAKSVFEALSMHILCLSLIYIFPHKTCEARLGATIVTSFLVLGVFLPKTRMSEVLGNLFRMPNRIIPNWQYLKEGLPLSANGLLGLIGNNGDRYLIEKLANKEQLGYLGFGNSISSILMMGFSSFNNVWLGVFYQRERTTNWRMRYSAIVFLGWVVLGAGLIAASMLAFSVLSSSFQKYTPALGVIPILVATICMQIAMHLLTNFFNLWKLNKYTTPINALSAIVSAASGYYLIPRWGASGAACQSAIASFVGLIALVVSFIYFKRKRHANEND